MPDERRVVTVLFADVVSSTALAESVDAEDVRVLMGRYYGIAKRVMLEHGGTLEKFIGDAIMAIFGLPVAHGDDAERACAAALALRAAIGADPATAAIQLRIGVNTGEVVASRDTDAGDFLVTGDAVNLAARLQQHADAGVILAGERTRIAVDEAFRFGESRSLSLKGKAEPVRAAPLEGRSESAGRRARAPFVGREADLEQLALVARRAFAERRPQLVTITAPAGTGKSRLVSEFLATLSEARVATAQCLPYGAAVTYLPLRGLVQGLLDADDGDLVPAVRARLVAGGDAPADAVRIAGLIGATLGQGEGEDRDRDQLFAAWKLLIERIAVERPIVVVFEDLHWASDSLLDLVEHITHPRTGAPLLMLALARPELLDRRPLWGGGRRNFTALGLEPLSQGDTRRLIGLLTEGVPDAIAAGVIERAGGNPFFASELIRGYEDRRRAGASDAEITLPDTVHATVLARLDSLPPTERLVLQYGAAAGRTVRLEALAAVLPDRSTAAVREALEALADRDLLVTQGGDAFTFRHIVIREVAYSTLSRSDRVRAHLALADWLDGTPLARQDELAELVAYHIRQAIALAPGQGLPAGLSLERAVQVLERAARAAWTAAAFAEAAEHLREAIRLSPPSEHQRLHELMGDVVQIGDAAIEGYRRAYELWSTLPPGERLPSDGTRLLMKRLTVEGRWAGSVLHVAERATIEALLAEARDLLARAPDPVLRAQLDCAEAFCLIGHSSAGRERQAPLLADLAAAEAAYRTRGDANGQSVALDALGSMLRDRGRFAEAVACSRRRTQMQGLTLLERLDAWSVLCWDLVSIGRFREATGTFDAARASLRPGEPEAVLNHLVSWATLAARLRGDWPKAEELGNWLRSFWEDQGRRAGFRHVLTGWFAALHVARARLDATRVASYRSAIQVIADLATFPAGRPLHHVVPALLDGDLDHAEAALRHPDSFPEPSAEVIALLVLEHERPIAPGDLAALDRWQTPNMTARVGLARALVAGPDALRAAAAALDAADLGPDAARALALVALRTGDLADRDIAVTRLRALDDRLFLERLA
ncbi:MAG: hypothetical protein NVS9B6_09480 [Candidatus Limnocylindrales bacterium]